MRAVGQTGAQATTEGQKGSGAHRQSKTGGQSEQVLEQEFVRLFQTIKAGKNVDAIPAQLGRFQRQPDWPTRRRAVGSALVRVYGDKGGRRLWDLWQNSSHAAKSEKFPLNATQSLLAEKKQTALVQKLAQTPAQDRPVDWEFLNQNLQEALISALGREGQSVFDDPLAQLNVAIRDSRDFEQTQALLDLRKRVIYERQAQTKRKANPAASQAEWQADLVARTRRSWEVISEIQSDQFAFKKRREEFMRMPDSALPGQTVFREERLQPDDRRKLAIKQIDLQLAELDQRLAYERQRQSALTNDIARVSAGDTPQFLGFDAGPAEKWELTWRRAWGNVSSGALAGGAFLSRALAFITDWHPAGLVSRGVNWGTDWIAGQFGIERPPRENGFETAARWFDKASESEARWASYGRRPEVGDYMFRMGGYILVMWFPMRLVGRAKIPGLGPTASQSLLWGATGAAGHYGLGWEAMVKAGAYFALVPLGQRLSPGFRLAFNTMAGPGYAYLQTVNWQLVQAALAEGNLEKAKQVFYKTGNHDAAIAAGIMGFGLGVAREVNAEPQPNIPRGRTAQVNELNRIYRNSGGDETGGGTARTTAGRTGGGGGGGVRTRQPAGQSTTTVAEPVAATSVATSGVQARAGVELPNPPQQVIKLRIPIRFPGQGDPPTAAEGAQTIRIPLGTRPPGSSGGGGATGSSGGATGGEVPELSPGARVGSTLPDGMTPPILIAPPAPEYDEHGNLVMPAGGWRQSAGKGKVFRGHATSQNGIKTTRAVSDPQEGTAPAGVPMNRPLDIKAASGDGGGPLGTGVNIDYPKVELEAEALVEEIAMRSHRPNANDPTCRSVFPQKLVDQQTLLARFFVADTSKNLPWKLAIIDPRFLTNQLVAYLVECILSSNDADTPAAERNIAHAITIEGRKYWLIGGAGYVTDVAADYGGASKDLWDMQLLAIAGAQYRDLEAIFGDRYEPLLVENQLRGNATVTLPAATPVPTPIPVPTATPVAAATPAPTPIPTATPVPTQAPTPNTAVTPTPTATPIAAPTNGQPPNGDGLKVRVLQPTKPYQPPSSAETNGKAAPANGATAESSGKAVRTANRSSSAAPLNEEAEKGFRTIARNAGQSMDASQFIEGGGFQTVNEVLQFSSLIGGTYTEIGVTGGAPLTTMRSKLNNSGMGEGKQYAIVLLVPRQGPVSTYYLWSRNTGGKAGWQFVGPRQGGGEIISLLRIAQGEHQGVAIFLPESGFPLHAELGRAPAPQAEHTSKEAADSITPATEGVATATLPAGAQVLTMTGAAEAAENWDYFFAPAENGTLGSPQTLNVVVPQTSGQALRRAWMYYVGRRLWWQQRLEAPEWRPVMAGFDRAFSPQLRFSLFQVLAQTETVLGFADNFHSQESSPRFYALFSHLRERVALYAATISEILRPEMLPEAVAMRRAIETRLRLLVYPARIPLGLSRNELQVEQAGALGELAAREKAKRDQTQAKQAEEERRQQQQIARQQQQAEAQRRAHERTQMAIRLQRCFEHALGSAGLAANVPRLTGTHADFGTLKDHYGSGMVRAESMEQALDAMDRLRDATAVFAVGPADPRASTPLGWKTFFAVRNGTTNEIFFRDDNYNDVTREVLAGTGDLRPRPGEIVHMMLFRTHTDSRPSLLPTKISMLGHNGAPSINEFALVISGDSLRGQTEARDAIGALRPVIRNDQTDSYRALRLAYWKREMATRLGQLRDKAGGHPRILETLRRVSPEHFADDLATIEDKLRQNQARTIELRLVMTYAQILPSFLSTAAMDNIRRAFSNGITYGERLLHVEAEASSSRAPSELQRSHPGRPDSRGGRGRRR